MGQIPGIDAAAVSRFFAEQVPGGDVPLAFELISGGRSNLTYLVTGAPAGAGPRHWVLRRPPLGHVLPTAHDMSREHRVLAALAGTDVPAPRPLALCEDAGVNGAPFYVMTWCPGIVLNDSVPAGLELSADHGHRISEALVDTLVRLHAVDPRAVGLDDFGRPDGYLARQVKRWGQQWERSKTRELPEIDALAAWLAANLPASPAPTIVHGDYRLGNVALAADDPGRLVAVFDWEMATLGDPLADLGYLLMFWGDPRDAAEETLSEYHRITARPGFWTPAELTKAYAERSGREVSAIDVYVVLALYKLAVISEGIWARHKLGKTVGAGFEGMEQRAGGIARRAWRIIGG